MDIFQFLTICPPEIKDLALSDLPGKVVMALESKYGLTLAQGDQLTDVTRNVLFGLAPVDNLSERIRKIIPNDQAKAARVEADYRQKLILPNQKFLRQTEDEVRKFKADNNLPEVVIFDKPPKVSPIPVKPRIPAPAVPRRPVPTTSDIRRPVKRTPVHRPESVEGPPKVVPPATPVKPAASISSPAVAPRPSGAPPSGGGKPKLEQFQLRTVDDLVNVPPITLSKEPDDEKQLVGRFKQEIQDIANYSGAKRTDISAGWKKSQIYHTYIEMGNDSIQQGKPIGDIMAFRKTAGKPYLTENQFHAVSEISRLLLR